MGDLVLTTTGSLSRNRSLGVALGAGAIASRSIRPLIAPWRKASIRRAPARPSGEELGIELPITEQVCAVLFRAKPPREALAELMGRELKSEQWR